MDTRLVSVYSSSAPAFPIAVMASAYNSSMVKSAGISGQYSPLYCFIEHGQSTWYFEKKDIDSIASQLVKIIEKKPGFLNTIQKNFESTSKKALGLLAQPKFEKKLSTLSSSELLQLFENALVSYRNAIYWVEPPNFSLEIKGQEIIKEKFISFAKQHKPALKSSELSELFSTLSNPTERSFVADAELGLLKIRLLKNPKQQTAAIKKHVQKYYWQAYDYYGPLLDEKTMHEEIQQLEKLSESEIRDRIRKIESLEKTARQKLSQALKTAPLSAELKNAFATIRNFAFLYGNTKKERVSKCNVGLGRIVAEIAKQSQLPPHELHYATIEELKQLIQGKKLDLRILKNRMHRSCFIVENTEYAFLSSEQAKPIAAIIKQNEQASNQLIKGMAASPGYYRGPARVISNIKELDSFKTGEILVTKMTAVEFVPAMKKAGAIVTDLGGITCHAAIVSRELGVPCVIGTNNATQIIKTGETIEVNANHGIVRKLEGAT